MNRATIKLGEIGKISMCKRILKNQTKKSGDIPFYKISTFGGKADSYIDRALYEDYKKRFSYPNVGDILISAAGTLGRTVIFDGEESFFQDSNIVWVANDESKVLNRYLYYYYKLEPWKTTTGSTINRLYNDNLRDITVFYPKSLKEQKKIIDVLKTIDDKIENNEKINNKLEELARTIYEHWFLQYDFQDENGNPYKSSGGEMFYDEALKSTIPNGWKVKKLGTLIIERQKSSIKAKDAIGGDIPFFTSGDNIEYTKDALTDGLNCYLNTGGNAGVKVYASKASYSTDTWAITSHDGYKVFLYQYLKSILPIIQRSFFAGSGLKHLQKPALKDVKVAVPPQAIADRFERITAPFYSQIANNSIENKKLAELRDYLLPLLLNGQVTISD